MAKRASPVHLRKSLDVANVFVKAGLYFVPMPCADEAEFNQRMAESIAKLTELTEESIKGEQAAEKGGDANG